MFKYNFQIRNTDNILYIINVKQRVLIDKKL